MNYIIYDGDQWETLLPLTYTRPVADLRVGILTIREKWEKRLGFTSSTLTQDYLAGKFPLVEAELNLMINGSYCPNDELVEICKNLDPMEAVYYQDELMAFVTQQDQQPNIEEYKRIDYQGDLTQIVRPWDIFSNNDKELKIDFDLLTRGRNSQKISETNRVLKPDNIFIEEGAEVEFSILNAKDAPIYIGKDALVMENCSIRGGLAMCEGSVLKMGAKIYGATTLGPHSKVGGEVSNSVFIGYSNKGHDGFLGNAVLGEWCNLGADTNNSNLKNNYAQVKAWSYVEERFVDTELQFCGLIMGDHSKTGINTMLNTGTVVGVSSNIFGAGFPRNFIPSFAWGGASKTITYRVDKSVETAKLMMDRRHVEFTEEDLKIFEYISQADSKYRKD